MGRDFIRGSHWVAPHSRQHQGAQRVSFMRSAAALCSSYAHCGCSAQTLCRSQRRLCAAHSRISQAAANARAWAAAQSLSSYARLLHKARASQRGSALNTGSVAGSTAAPSAGAHGQVPSGQMASSRGRVRPPRAATSTLYCSACVTYAWPAQCQCLAALARRHCRPSGPSDACVTGVL